MIEITKLGVFLNRCLLFWGDYGIKRNPDCCIATTGNSPIYRHVDLGAAVINTSGRLLWLIRGIFRSLTLQMHAALQSLQPLLLIGNFKNGKSNNAPNA